MVLSTSHKKYKDSISALTLHPLELNSELSSRSTQQNNVCCYSRIYFFHIKYFNDVHCLYQNYLFTFLRQLGWILQVVHEP